MTAPWIEYWLPPALRDAANRVLGTSIRYQGPYADMATAKARVSGYDQAGILAAVEMATEQVMRGEVRYEQDSRTFLDEPPADHVLSGLLLAAACSGGHLSVLDFGGSLGSHFLRWRPLLAQLASTKWCVVEQAHFVEAGRRIHCSDARISFENTIQEAALAKPNTVLVSCVLQYLPDPYQTLSELADLRAPFLIIGRTPFSQDDRDHILSQHVGMPGNRSSYVLKTLSSRSCEEAVGEAYEKVLEFKSSSRTIHTSGVRAPFLDSIWKLRH